MSNQSPELLLHMLQQQSDSLPDQQTLHALLQTLTQDVAELRSEVETLRAVVASQDRQIEQLRSQRGEKSSLRSIDPPTQPPMQRSLEYWSEHVPDYGEELSQEQIEQHLAKPRRQASLVQTERLPQPAKRKSYQIEPPTPTQRVQSAVIILSVVLVAAFFVILMLNQ